MFIVTVNFSKLYILSNIEAKCKFSNKCYFTAGEFSKRKKNLKWFTIGIRNLNCRYFAVTRPIEYAKHKNNRRVWLTILLVWAVSAAIGSPIVLGLNNTPNRVPNLCLFYHTDFIIYSSLSSFYIPCITMVFLYYRIFNVSW